MKNYKQKKYLFILIPLGLFLILSWIIMLLWNNLIPTIFDLKSITYFQAMGLFILSRLLFGNLGFRNRKPPFMNQNLKEKWINMTEDEKIKFKEEWKNRC